MVYPILEAKVAGRSLFIFQSILFISFLSPFLNLVPLRFVLSSLIVCTYSFKIRLNPFVAKRQPTMFLVQFAALLIWTVNWNACSVIDAFKNELEDPVWDSVLAVLIFGTALSWTIVLGVGMARLWLLFWS